MLTIPRIRRELNLADYAAGYGGALGVWVNPSRRQEQRWLELNQEGANIMRSARRALGLGPDDTPSAEQWETLQADIDTRLDAWDRKMITWWAETWAVDADELLAVREEADPGLWRWMTSQSRALIDKYAEEISGPKSDAGSGQKPTEKDISSPI